jgi:hypothetical protein
MSQQVSAVMTHLHVTYIGKVWNNFINCSPATTTTVNAATFSIAGKVNKFYISHVVCRKHIQITDVNQLLTQLFQ